MFEIETWWDYRLWEWDELWYVVICDVFFLNYASWNLRAKLWDISLSLCILCRTAGSPMNSTSAHSCSWMIFQNFLVCSIKKPAVLQRSLFFALTNQQLPMSTAFCFAPRFFPGDVGATCLQRSRVSRAGGGCQTHEYLVGQGVSAFYVAKWLSWKLGALSWVSLNDYLLRLLKKIFRVSIWWIFGPLTWNSEPRQ